MKINPETMTYVAPAAILLAVEQEGLLCQSTIIGNHGGNDGNHGGFDNGGDIEVNMNE